MALKLAICSGTFSFQRTDVLRMLQAISKAGFSGTDLLDKHIQEHIQGGHSIQEIKNLLKEHKLHPLALHALRDWQNWGSKKSELTSTTFASKEEYRKFVEQFIDQCGVIGCDFAVCSAWAEDSDMLKDIQGFTEVCDIARGYDIRVALEFLPWAELRDIKRAWEVVRRANRPNGGLLVDTFHFFKGGSQMEDLREVPTEKIFLIHFNDAPDLPIDSKKMCFDHRTFPGEGVFPLGQFLDVLLLEKGYRDWISLEVLNKENQNLDYDEVAQRGRESMEKVLGRYSL